MIWCAGRILPDDGLTINASDRAFEHGLGLFETLRTWDGSPFLWEAHRSRMLSSAEALRIPIDPARFPLESDVARLLEAEGSGEDRVLRITASGGSPSEDSVVWMRTRSLSPSIDGGIRVELGSWAILPDDPLARHKSLNYWSRRIAREEALGRGFDETLGSAAGGGYVEGSISNLFRIRRSELATPSLDAPIIPGVMRRLVLDLARELSIPCREVAGFSDRELEGADEVFLTNSVRGIVPVARLEHSRSGRGRDWDAPGPSTRALQLRLAGRLGGTSP